MLYENDIDTLRTITLLIVAIGQTAFALLYSVFPWRKSFLGRALFFKAFTFAVLVDVFLLTRLIDIANSDIIFVILYTMLGVGVWFQFFAFLKVRRDGQEKERRDATRRKAGL
jgi:Na+/phosphate symporter